MSEEEKEKAPEWRYAEKSPLQSSLVEALKKAKTAAEAELAAARRKLEKLKYGS
jgi:hypothetical protein